MLVNNLCCDELCLSKVFSTHTKPISKKMYSTSASILNQILPLIQKGPLEGSQYRLEAVQSKQYVNVTRYFLLYQIISSYSSEYISKRAVVDYDKISLNITIIDWSKITYESDFTVIDKQDLQVSTY